MADEPQLIYLEPDDEITSVVRRLRAAEGRSVVIVAPGRSRATSSSVALRLLAQVAAEEKRGLALVADPATRAVAGEAGIAAYASVAEASSGKAAVDPVAATPRAPIHVVRGMAEILPLFPSELGAAADRPGPGDETVVVRTPKRASPGGPSRRDRGRSRIPSWPWLAALLVVLLATAAALLPSATIRITPSTVAVGPKSYPLGLPIAGRQSNELQATVPGTATGERLEQVSATGRIIFFNWNTVAVEVPQGTQVSADGATPFVSDERIVVPAGHLGPDDTIVPGEGRVAATAVTPGADGNLAAEAIDTIDDNRVRVFLRGFANNKDRLVINRDPMAGGEEVSHPVIQQSDVDAVVAAIQTDLATQLAEVLAGQTDRLYAGPQPGEAPVIDVPVDLVGTEERPTFELGGTLTVDRPYIARGDVQEAAGEALRDDTTAAPPGTAIVPGSVSVEIGTATATAEEMIVQAMVRAAAAAAIDESMVRDRVAGMTVDEARAELADIGAVRVDLWPGWLDRLPRIPFRISVETVAESPAVESPGFESPGASESP